MEKRSFTKVVRTNRRRVLPGRISFVFTAALCLLLASCEKKDEKAAVKLDKNNPIDITFWYAFIGKIQECNVNLANQFNETIGKEMKIRVNAENQGDYEAVHQKLQASWVAGNPPDVSVIEIASMGGFAQNGVLHPPRIFSKKRQCQY